MTTKSKAVAKKEEKAIITRPPELIAAEIRSIDQQARQFFLQSAVEIGKRLVEAKALVPHGEWGKWLEENVSYKQSTANNFMRIADEYSENIQALGNLSYTQAVALLALPSEEREQFVEENNVSDMSTRELQAAIKEKHELEKRLKEEQERQAKQKAEYDKLVEEQKQQREALQQQYQAETNLRKEQEEKVRELESEVEKAKKAGDSKEMAKLKTELRKAEKDVSASKDKLSQLEEALKQKDAELEKTVEERLKQQEQEIVAKADKEKQAMQEQMAKLEQQLQRSNNEAFLKAKLQIQQLVSVGDILVKAIAEVKEPEEQGKLKDAAAKVVDQLRGLL